MLSPTDHRIPLTVLKGPGALAAWLAAGGPAALVVDGPLPDCLALPAERFDPAQGHRIGCTCCAGRPPAAIALDRLFQARIRGACAWFDRVGAWLVTPAARVQVRTTCQKDALTLARFRLL